jgi:hypothetical protein
VQAELLICLQPLPGWLLVALVLLLGFTLGVVTAKPSSQRPSDFKPGRYWVVGAALLPPCIPLSRWLLEKQSAPDWQQVAIVAILLMSIAAVQLYGQRRSQAERDAADAAVGRIGSGVSSIGSGVSSIATRVEAIEDQIEALTTAVEGLADAVSKRTFPLRPGGLVARTVRSEAGSIVVGAADPPATALGEEPDEEEPNVEEGGNAGES